MNQRLLLISVCFTGTWIINFCCTIMYYGVIFQSIKKMLQKKKAKRMIVVHYFLYESSNLTKISHYVWGAHFPIKCLLISFVNNNESYHPWKSIASQVWWHPAMTPASYLRHEKNRTTMMKASRHPQWYLWVVNGCLLKPKVPCCKELMPDTVNIAKILWLERSHTLQKKSVTTELE